MTLVKRYTIDKSIGKEAFEKVRQMEMEDLFADIAKHDIELDRPYSFVFKDDRYSTFDDRYFPDMENRKMAVTIEPIPQIKMIYKAPEDLHFTRPSKSLWTKLKNCWNYLCDDSEGIYEQEK